MLHHPTLDQLRHLKLHGMARAFAELGDNAQAGELDHAQWLALLLDREEAERNDPLLGLVADQRLPRMRVGISMDRKERYLNGRGRPSSCRKRSNSNSRPRGGR